MKRFYRFFNGLHSRINENFQLPLFFSLALLTLYTIVTGFAAYLINYDLLGEADGLMDGNYFVVILRMFILLLFINFNIIYLYLLVRYFKQKKIPLRVIYSYYAVFATFLFLLAILLFFAVLFSYYVLGMQTEHILLIFGLAILIILTGANLYPAYFLFLSLKEEPVDVFWAIILCILGIHVFSYVLFNIWNRIHIFQLWVS